MRREEETAAPETEDNPQNVKKEPRFRLAELIAFAFAAVCLVVAISINMRTITAGELILEPRSSPAVITETRLIVNINTADAKELMSLDGIGEVLAARIVEYRNEHGGFETVWEITKVKGISQNMFNKLYPHITV